MSEAKNVIKPVSLPENSSRRVELSGITETFTISNGGADNKTDIRLSAIDPSGNYHRVLAIKALMVGESLKFDLTKLNKQIAKAKLMYRGKDGIGRHVGPIEARPGKFFSSLDLIWFTQQDDHSIEEHFFRGEGEEDVCT